MVKVKHFETADVVVGGYTGRPAEPYGLILGLYDGQGVLHHVGTTSILTGAMRAATLQLTPSENRFDGLQPGRGRWAGARFDEWVPVEPSIVCEVGSAAWTG